VSVILGCNMGNFKVQIGNFRLQYGNYRLQYGNYRLQYGNYRLQIGLQVIENKKKKTLLIFNIANCIN
jgi:hypothetical protein